MQKRLSKFLGFSIPYEIRIPNGDSSPFFGNYVSQKYGPYDTNTCWEYGLCESMETQLELERSLNRFSKEQLDWFQKSGYIDEDGDFYLSRRWGAIMSGVEDSGNDPEIGWKLAEKVGMIPFSMLPYSVQDAADENTRAEFVDEYFNLKVITQAMKDMGQEFLKRVSISSEELGSRWTKRTPSIIMDALKQGSLEIGVPVPGYLWNQVNVPWDGGKNASHAVELYQYVENDPYPYRIYDSYEPHLKRLSADYFIPVITRGILKAKKPITIGDQTISYSIIQQLIDLLKKIGVWTIKGLRGIINV